MNDIIKLMTLEDREKIAKSIRQQLSRELIDALGSEELIKEINTKLGLLNNMYGLSKSE